MLLLEFSRPFLKHNICKVELTEKLCCKHKLQKIFKDITSSSPDGDQTYCNVRNLCESSVGISVLQAVHLFASSFCSSGASRRVPSVVSSTTTALRWFQLPWLAVFTICLVEVAHQSCRKTVALNFYGEWGCMSSFDGSHMNQVLKFALLQLVKKVKSASSEYCDFIHGTCVGGTYKHPNSWSGWY